MTKILMIDPCLSEHCLTFHQNRERKTALSEFVGHSKKCHSVHRQFSNTIGRFYYLPILYSRIHFVNIFSPQQISPPGYVYIIYSVYTVLYAAGCSQPSASDIRIENRREHVSIKELGTRQHYRDFERRPKKLLIIAFCLYSLWLFR